MTQFEDAYLEAAAFFDCGPDEHQLCVAAFSPVFLERAARDCAAFQRDHAADLEATGATDEMLGHDLWLTRNGHGAGFWGRDYPEDAAGRLTRAAEAFGRIDLYVGDDGLIYGS